MHFLFKYRYLFGAAFVLVFAQAACLIGGQDSKPTEVLISTEVREELPSPTEPPAQVSEGGYEEAELPEGFPPDFPIPEGARVGSSVNLSGEDHFRVFFALPGTLEEVLAFYRAELPAAGWEITQEGKASGGTRLEVLGSTYAGELLFVPAETGVGLDVSLVPFVDGDDQPDLPDVPEGLGESVSLGEAAGDLPEDLPIPASFNPVPLSTELEGQGCLLAYGFNGPAELALADLTMALVNGGWEVGEPGMDASSRTYRMPFSDPDSGDKGCAWISGDPASLGMEDLPDTLILFGDSCKR